MCGELGRNMLMLSSESWHLLKFERDWFTSRKSDWLWSISIQADLFDRAFFFLFFFLIKLLFLCTYKQNFLLDNTSSFIEDDLSKSASQSSPLYCGIGHSHSSLTNLDFSKETQSCKMAVVGSPQYKHLNETCGWLKTVRIQELLIQHSPPSSEPYRTLTQ